jgi:hypothetical protein
MSSSCDGALTEPSGRKAVATGRKIKTVGGADASEPGITPPVRAK